MNTRTGITCATALMILGACAHAGTPTHFIRNGESPAEVTSAVREGSTVRTEVEARRHGTSALIISGDYLRHETGTLLSALTRRVSGMQVHNSAECPEISLRGRNSILGSPNPAIYVDGTPAVNTCILESLNASDVDHVEVYRMGVSPHAGYRTNSNGLIVVFMRER